VSSSPTDADDRSGAADVLRPHAPLREYRRWKLDLADVIRVLMDVANARDDEVEANRSRDLLARLAEDRFNLAVVGQFSRGKSTLMNAILGSAFLPTGAMPMTSVITTVRYGSHPRALVRRQGSSLPVEVALENLEQFVSERSRERDRLRVVSADVEVPAEILRLGFSFVDTPGVGSAVVENTTATKGFLPEADAVIFVTSFDAPLTATEFEFLSEVRQHVAKLFFVVNKLDLVSGDERDSAVRFVRERLSAGLGLRDVGVFALSARDALDAKTSDDENRLVASGLTDLERALASFLTADKSKELLLRVTRRASRLAARQVSEVVISRAAAGDVQLAQARLSQFDNEVERIVLDVRQVVSRLRGTIDRELSEFAVDQSPSWRESVRSVLTPEVERVWASVAKRSTARASVEKARVNLEECGRDLVPPLLDPRVHQMRTLTMRMVQQDRFVLEELEESVDATGARVFGVELPKVDSGGSGRPIQDMPWPVASRVWSLRCRVSWWFHVVPASWVGSRARRRLTEALQASITASCDAVLAEVTGTARAWAENLGEEIENRTNEAAERFRANLGTPANEEDEAVLEGLQQRLTALAAEIAEWKVGTADEAESTAAGTRAAQGAVAHATGGCVICRRLREALFEFMRHDQFDLATREDRRAEHAEVGGFCALHTWQYAEMGSDVGISIGYARLAAANADALRTAAQGASTEEQLEQVVTRLAEPLERCRACRALAAAEREAVRETVANLQDIGEPAPTLCLPHLSAVLKARPGVARGELLLRAAADVLSRASEDMRTFALKRQALHRELISTEESSAYLRTLSYLAGLAPLARPEGPANWPSSE
jgi:small GTP-binding protein